MTQPVTATYRAEQTGVVLGVNTLLDHDTFTSDLPRPVSALAVGAHPDDIEFGCCATLAKWAEEGTRVHHVVLTDGSRGAWEVHQDRRALAVMRETEQQAAAQALVGNNSTGVTFLRRVDGELREDDETRSELVRVIRTFQPEVILGHDPWRRYRLHPDHRHAGFLLTDAIVAARDPLYATESGLRHHRPRALLLWEADEPNHVEDAAVGAVRKLQALLQHRSQYPSTMGIPADTPPLEPDDDRAQAFCESVRATMRAHGALAHGPGREVAGSGLGEAFRRLDDI